MLHRPEKCDDCPIGLICHIQVEPESLPCNKVWYDLQEWFKKYPVAENK